MNRKRTAPFFAALFAGSLLAGAAIDNSALMPPYKPDAEVIMEKDAEGGETPDWIKSLIIVELRIHSASTDGTVKGLLPALDHLAEMGERLRKLRNPHPEPAADRREESRETVAGAPQLRGRGA